jgi:hypothetical protein
MRLLRIALWTACGFTLLLVTAFCCLWFLDLGFLKPQVERWVTTTVGREFRIDGRFEVNLGSESFIIAEGVRLDNPDWSGSREMITIEHVELRVDTFSFYSKPLTVGLIKLRGAEIRLERREQEAPNWVLADLPAKVEKEDASNALDLIIGRIDIEDVRIVYEGPERTGPLIFEIQAFNQRHRSDDFLELKLDAELEGRTFDAQGVIGSWDALLAQKNLEYDIKAQLDAFDFSSTGTIDDLAAPMRPSLEFTASGPDINDLRRLLKIEEAGSGDIDLSGSIKPADGGPLVLAIEGRLGEARIDASGTVSDLQNLESFDTTIRASAPDLSRLLALAGFYRVGEAPFLIDIDARRAGPMLAVDRAHIEFVGVKFDLQARLPSFPSLDAGNAELEISGSDFARLRDLFRLPGSADGPFSVGLQLAVDANGEERVRVAVVSTLADLEADGQIRHGTNFAGSEFDFKLSTASMARAGNAYSITGLPDVPAGIRGAVRVEENAILTRGPLTIEIQDLEARLEGLIALAQGGSGSQASFGVRGPDLAKVVGMFVAADKVPALPFELDGEAEIQSDGIRLRGVRGMLGQSDVEINGLLRPVKALVGSDFRLVSSGPALEELLNPETNVDIHPGAYSLSGALGFGAKTLNFRDIKLSRDRGELNMDVELGLPLSTRQFDFDISGRGNSVHAVIASLGEFDIAELPFSIATRGKLRDTHLTLAKLDLGVGESTLEAKGDLDLIKGGRSTRFEFDLHIPNLANLGVFDERRMRVQAIEASGKVRGNDSAVWFDGLEIRLGDSDIGGSISLEKGEVPNLLVALQSDSILVLPLLEGESPPYDATPKFDDGRLIPNVGMPFDAMKKLNASLSLDVAEFRRDTLLLHGVKVKARLHDGAVYVDEVRLEDDSGWFQVNGSLEPAEGKGKARLAIKARDFSPGILGLNQGPSTGALLDINLEATGTDLRTLAGTSTGVMFVDIRSWVIPENRLLKRIYGDLLNEIVDTINPFSKAASETKIDCIVLPVEINDGNLSFAPQAFVRTDALQIFSRSSIELKSEKIEMNFRTTPRKGLTISAGEILNPYVMVVGSLAAPRLALDTTGSLISGGAAFATGGLSILARATWNRLARSATPCETAADDGRELLQDRFADFQAAE